MRITRLLTSLALVGFAALGTVGAAATADAATTHTVHPSDWIGSGLRFTGSSAYTNCDSAGVQYMQNGQTDSYQCDQIAGTPSNPLVELYLHVTGTPFGVEQAVAATRR